MGQSTEREENDAGKQDSMLVVLRKKIRETKCPGRHFPEQRTCPIPLILPREIDAVAVDEIAAKQSRQRDERSLKNPNNYPWHVGPHAVVRPPMVACRS